ncbi:MAG: hypothetical protein IKI05_07400 [Bacteroidaceae bacterium]|nr:hypothetical protein [Bacteroidaceae bacterium]
MSTGNVSELADELRVYEEAVCSLSTIFRCNLTSNEGCAFITPTIHNSIMSTK